MSRVVINLIENPERPGHGDLGWVIFEGGHYHGQTFELVRSPFISAAEPSWETYVRTEIHRVAEGRLCQLYVLKGDHKKN